MTEEKDERYILKDTTVNLFLRGFEGNKPLWSPNKKEAIEYKEMDALRVQRRLENLYAPTHKIVVIPIK